MKKDLKARKFLAREIRILRAKLDISQEDLANRADCHPNYIQKIEREKANPSLNAITSIARALGASPKDLLPEK